MWARGGSGAGGAGTDGAPASPAALPAELPQGGSTDDDDGDDDEQQPAPRVNIGKLGELLAAAAATVTTAKEIGGSAGLERPRL